MQEDRHRCEKNIKQIQIAPTTEKPRKTVPSQEGDWEKSMQRSPKE